MRLATAHLSTLWPFSIGAIDSGDLLPEIPTDSAIMPPCASCESVKFFKLPERTEMEHYQRFYVWSLFRRQINEAMASAATTENTIPTLVAM